MNIKFTHHHNNITAYENKQKSYSPISFGYDIEANDKLTAQADEQDIEEIIELQYLTNQAENHIRILEETSTGTRLALNNVCNIFLPLKIALIKLVKYNLDDSDFPETEGNHYLNEAILLDKEDKEAGTKSNEDKVNWRILTAIAIEKALNTDMDDVTELIQSKEKLSAHSQLLTNFFASNPSSN